MRERIGDERAREQVLRDLLARLRRDDERDGVEQHRRRRRERPLGLEPGAVLGLDAADRRRDELDGGADVVELRLELPQEAGVDAVRHERAELAAAERLRPAAHDAERRRRRQIATRRHDTRRRHRQRIEPQAFGDVHRELVVDVQQVRHDARADGVRLDLAQLEYERSRDVLALERRLAHVELPRLVVVIGEALGASATLRTAHVLAVRHETAARRLPGARGPPSHEFGS